MRGTSCPTDPGEIAVESLLAGQTTRRAELSEVQAEQTARNIGNATTQDRPPSDEACVKASLIMLLTRLWNASVCTRAVLRRRMPTNILLDKIRTRRGLKWGIPAMLLGAVYMFAAVYCTIRILHGWSQWLYLPFLILVWNGMKFILVGPFSLVLLVRVRIAEARNRRRARRALVSS